MYSEAAQDQNDDGGADEMSTPVTPVGGVPVAPTQHSTSLGPGHKPDTKPPAQLFEVGSQKPLPVEAEHEATQHSISDAPGQ